MKAKLKKSSESKIKKISREEFPKEACGLLLGERKNEVIFIHKIRPTKNILESAQRFKIDPKVVLNITEELRKEEKSLQGFFHSHPSFTATPSKKDEKFMKLWPKKIWIIASVDETGGIKEMKAYQSKEENILELEIIIE